MSMTILQYKAPPEAFAFGGAFAQCHHEREIVCEELPDFDFSCRCRQITRHGMSRKGLYREKW